jgi:hypothetical protein
MMALASGLFTLRLRPEQKKTAGLGPPFLFV